MADVTGSGKKRLTRIRSVAFTDDEDKALKERAYLTDQSVSSFIRAAAVDALKKAARSALKAAA